MLYINLQYMYIFKISNEFYRPKAYIFLKHCWCYRLCQNARFSIYRHDRKNPLFKNYHPSMHYKCVAICIDFKLCNNLLLASHKMELSDSYGNTLIKSACAYDIWTKGQVFVCWSQTEDWWLCFLVNKYTLTKIIHTHPAMCAA